MESGWNPTFEDLLEQQPDFMISFNEYECINDAVNPSGSITTVDPICRLELATMIAQNKQSKIGVLEKADELISDKKGAEVEVTKYLRMAGLEAEDRNCKISSKKTQKNLLADEPMQVSGVKNIFVDDNFFKLTSKPSLPFEKEPVKNVPTPTRSSI